MRQALPVSHVSAIMTDPCWDAPGAWPHDGGHHGFESGETFAATYRRLGLNMLPKHATCKDAPIFLKTALPKWSNGSRPAACASHDTFRKCFDEYRGYHRINGLLSAIRAQHNF